MATVTVKKLDLREWELLTKVNQQLLDAVKLVAFFGLSGNGVHFVTRDDKVYGMGNNEYGMLGIGNADDTLEPVEINQLSGKQVIAFASGYYHSMCLTKGGQVYSWGYNGSGQLGVGNKQQTMLPLAVPTLTDVSQIACGGSHCLALTRNGQVYAWGWNEFKQAGVEVPEDVLFPSRVDFPLGVSLTAVTCGAYHSVALSAQGLIFCWGDNDNGRLGTGEVGGTYHKPMIVQEAPDHFVKVACGARHTLGLTEDGQVWAWGWNRGDSLGIDIHEHENMADPAQVKGLPRAFSIFAIYRYFISVAKTEDGVYAWGDFAEPPMTIGNHSKPNKVSLMEAVIAFSNKHSPTILIEGTTLSDTVSSLDIAVDSEKICSYELNLTPPSADFGKEAPNDQETFLKELCRLALFHCMRFVSGNEMVFNDILTFMDKFVVAVKTYFEEFKAGVVKNCKEVLTAENAAAIYHAAVNVDDEEAQKVTLQYILGNFNKVSESDGYGNLESEKAKDMAVQWANILHRYITLINGKNKI